MYYCVDLSSPIYFLSKSLLSGQICAVHKCTRHQRHPSCVILFEPFCILLPLPLIDLVIEPRKTANNSKTALFHTMRPRFCRVSTNVADSVCHASILTRMQYKPNKVNQNWQLKHYSKYNFLRALFWHSMSSE